MQLDLSSIQSAAMGLPIDERVQLAQAIWDSIEEMEVAPDPAALPPEELRISSVRERAYRGYCVHNNEVLVTARQFRSARPQLIGAITQVPGLDERAQRRAIAFLDPFFNQIATDQAVSANLLSRCVAS